MPKTLLAVDDSATMRKVIEITFGGEDFDVLLAADRAGAMASLASNPRAVLIDAALAEDGYAVAKELRHALPNAAIVLLSSRYSPYDQAKARDAGADDFIDKPFDTQQIIDKVKKLVAAKDATERAPEAMPAATATQPEARPLPPAGPARQFTPSPGPLAALKPPMPVTRSGTLSFPSGVPSTTAATPTPPAPTPPATPTPRPMAATTATAKVDSALTSKLADLGLTDVQVAAVLALSREVVEQVVWEVVPVLAETLLREEIARLTKES